MSPLAGEWQQCQLEPLSSLIAECYDLARDEAPTLARTLGVRFSMRGEPDIGGLVEGSGVMDDYSSIEHPSMIVCTTRWLYALELEPPLEGTTVGRQLSLRFGEWRGAAPDWLCP